MNLRSLALPLSLLATVVGCAATTEAPSDEAPESTSEAICGNGIHPGCGDCVNGHQTCWTCVGSTTRTCKSPPPPLTWSGHAWTWNTDNHPENADFNFNVRFANDGGVEHMYVDSVNLSLGLTYHLQPGRVGVGTINGDHATFELPLHGDGYGQSIDVTLELTTDSTIYPQGGSPATVGPHSGTSLNMVGTGPYNGGSTFWAFFVGNITQWPN